MILFIFQNFIILSSFFTISRKDESQKNRKENPSFENQSMFCYYVDSIFLCNYFGILQGFNGSVIICIISLTVFQSICFVHSSEIIVLDLEVNILAIVFLSQPVFYQSIRKWFVIFKMNTISDDLIGLLDSQSKVTQVSKLFDKIFTDNCLFHFIHHDSIKLLI